MELREWTKEDQASSITPAQRNALARMNDAADHDERNVVLVATRSALGARWN